MSVKDSTQAALFVRLHYNPEAGEFIAKTGCNAGKALGRVHRLGYLQIFFAGKLHYAHRLAWLYIHGQWPEGEIDHLNGDKSDNRLANLRVVSRQENMQNVQRKPTRGKSSSEYLGVSRDGRMKTRPWRATVYLNGRNHDCGYWETEAQAHAAYVAKKRELHPGNLL